MFWQNVVSLKICYLSGKRASVLKKKCWFKGENPVLDNSIVFGENVVHPTNLGS